MNNNPPNATAQLVRDLGALLALSYLMGQAPLPGQMCTVAELVFGFFYVKASTATTGGYIRQPSTAHRAAAGRPHEMLGMIQFSSWQFFPQNTVVLHVYPPTDATSTFVMRCCTEDPLRSG